MMARLQSFYGGDPAGWLSVPIGYLRVLADHLPRLRAERSLEQYAVTLAGSGHMEKGSHSQWVRDLKRAARDPNRRAAKASAADLHAMGIQVETTEGLKVDLDEWLGRA